MQAKKAAVAEIQDQIDALGSTPTYRARGKALESKMALAVSEVAEAEKAVAAALAKSTADAATEGVKDDAEQDKDDDDDDAMPTMIIVVAAVVICGGALCLFVVARTAIRSKKARQPCDVRSWMQLVLPF